MIEDIAKFIDFNPKMHDDNKIINEFIHKYENTYLWINNKLTKIVSILQNPDTGIWELNENILNIESIREFTPKTGLYFDNNWLIYLYRVPKRQWKKSFAFKENYDAIILQPKKTILSSKTLVNFITDKNTDYAKESAIYNNNVYLHTVTVGTVDRKTLLIQDRYQKEIEELWKQYKVISVANHLQKPLDNEEQVPF